MQVNWEPSRISGFEVMRKCGDEVRELLHDGYPVVCLGDAPFGYVNVFTSHINVGFFHGAALPDPAPAAAEFQIPRVARERTMKEDDVRTLVQEHTKDRDLGFPGEPRVNVLELNLDLDSVHPLR
jgi:hypothetical protein